MQWTKPVEAQVRGIMRLSDASCTFMGDSVQRMVMIGGLGNHCTDAWELNLGTWSGAAQQPGGGGGPPCLPL